MASSSDLTNVCEWKVEDISLSPLVWSSRCQGQDLQLWLSDVHMGRSCLHHLLARFHLHCLRHLPPVLPSLAHGSLSFAKRFRNGRDKELEHLLSMFCQNWNLKSCIHYTFYRFWYCTFQGAFKRAGGGTDSWFFGWHPWVFRASRFWEKLSHSGGRGGKVPGIAFACVLKGRS